MVRTVGPLRPALGRLGIPYVTKSSGYADVPASQRQPGISRGTAVRCRCEAGKKCVASPVRSVMLM